MAEAQEVPAGTSSIEISGAEAFADTDAILTATITCDPVCDLSGQTLEFRDADGNQLGSAEIVAFEESANQTDEISIRVPAKAGTATWTAVLPAHETDGVAYPEQTLTFEVKVNAHPVHMTVWGLPYSTGEGEKLAFKAGVKCGVGCDLAGARLEILDGDGNQVAEADSGTEPWEGTKALYAADFSVRAPDAEGEHAWEARIAESDEIVSHAAGVYQFRIRVTPPPEVVATVKVRDKESKKPVQGARVVMHPYRAETNAKGIARIRAAKGDYTIFVSKAKRDPMSTTVALDKDFSTTVELVEEEAEFNPDDNY